MSQPLPSLQGPVCPVPLSHQETIVLGHGSGGKLSHDLIRRVFHPYLLNDRLAQGDDAAAIELESGARLAVSTDAHVVAPLFFPGGDIGRLAVCGTVNDVAMLGAIPRQLTAGFILEEGLDVHLLSRVLASMQSAAEEAGVEIVAGDTKVVQRGKADQLYITTTGVGVIPAGRSISGRNAHPGDTVLISGTIGEHGIAVLGARGELGFSSEITSDVAPLNHLIDALLQAAPDVHVLRDPTRGGLATTLCEIAGQSGVSIILEEGKIPVQPAVAAACEMLGFDPMYVANEGKVVVILPESQAGAALEALRAHPYGRQAALIGSVAAASPGRVLMKTAIGGTRIVDMLAGEMLPRIC